MIVVMAMFVSAQIVEPGFERDNFQSESHLKFTRFSSPVFRLL
jgi:hypothetical protein